MQRQLLLIVVLGCLCACGADNTSGGPNDVPDATSDVSPKDTDGVDNDAPDARPDVSPRDTDIAPDSADGDLPEPADTGSTAAHRAFLVIHADPHDEAICAPGGEWEKLEAVVEAASDRDHRLTILFSADWADCIVPSSSHLDTVAAWVRAGHQIGYHHHDCSHTAPDGYRSPDIEGCNPMCRRCGGKDNGTAAQALAKVREISDALVQRGVDAADAAIDTANMGPDRLCAGQGICFRQYEWDADLPFGTEQVADNPAPGGDYRFLTSPHCAEYGDGSRSFDVVEIGHAQLDVGSFASINAGNNHASLSAELDRLREGFEGQEVHAGIVFHPHEFTAAARTDTTVAGDDRAYLIAVMDLLRDKGFSTVPVREVLRTSNACR